MIFSRIIYSAILVGIVTGSLLSCLQVVSLNRIIFAAESYEIEAGASISTDGDGHADHAHDQGQTSWMPEHGFDRTAYTFLANICVSIGFAAIMLALMSQFWLPKNRNISWTQGSLWGLAGFSAVFLAPAIGLPPEIPGVVVAPLEHRQTWWALTALSTIAGIVVLAFAPKKTKLLGLLVLVIPHIAGAPRSDGLLFQHPNPAVVSSLTQLHQQFIVASGVTNLVFWLLLGLACRFAFNRWLSGVRINEDKTG